MPHDGDFLLACQNPGGGFYRVSVIRLHVGAPFPDGGIKLFAFDSAVAKGIHHAGTEDTEVFD